MRPPIMNTNLGRALLAAIMAMPVGMPMDLDEWPDPCQSGEAPTDTSKHRLRARSSHKQNARRAKKGRK